MDVLRRSRTFLFCLSLPVFPQQITAPREPIEPSRARAYADTSRRITLDVVVTEKSGKPALNLQQPDFAVLDNKEPKKILSFQAVEGTTAGPPVEIVLLFDRVNTSVLNVTNAVEGAKRFLGQNGGQLAHPVSLVYFSETKTSIENATRDGNALIADLDQTESSLRVITRSQGFYGGLDRVRLSLKALNSVAAYEEMKLGKKMLIWLSPGWPILSVPIVDLSSKEKQGLFDAIVAATTALLQAGITLYSVDPLGMSNFGASTAYEPFLKGVRSPRQMEGGNLALQVLAFQSGGSVLKSSNDIAGQIAKCAADTNAYYVLSFDASRGDGENEYHRLEVRISKPGLAVRTRTGYYAQP
jgi:VWFA-related protein